ncbi:MAG: hypothetical protein KAT01_11030 [Candidatus Aminicenantes bacterium]|nr:hypothetical protein [Candidatus Aminicenantes bacterium]
MANKRNNDSRTDDLLKHVLKDDLPPEVEGRMKTQFIQFRERVAQDERASELTSSGNWKRFFQLRWAIRREVLAFSSLIMIVIGAFLHVSGHRSAMAETLSFLNTSVSVADQVQNATSMECRMQVPAEDGQYLSYTIHWLSLEMTRVDVQEGETASKSLSISGSDITVVDHINNAFQKYQSLEHIKDPVFKPALEFLSPIVLATAIYEKWKPQHYREEDEGQKRTFVYLNNGERATLEMTVDMNTNLPVSIRKFSSGLTGADDVYKLAMEAQFVWNESISPQLKKEDVENDLRK